MATLAALLMLSVLSSGCMYDTRAVGSDSGLANGEGGGAGATEGAVGGAGGVGGIGGDDASGGSDGEAFGQACTPATERTDCPGTSCDPATMRCSSFKLASRALCWTCVSDTDCVDPNQRCVEMYFEGERFPDDKHGFCLEVARVEVELDDGAYEIDDFGESSCDKPFKTLLVRRPSLSGLPTNHYCGLREDLTTCFALRAFQNQEACPGGTDEECPVGGICRPFSDGAHLVNCCTFDCAADKECPLVDGAEPSCDAYCGG